MADLDRKEESTPIVITNRDETFQVDVVERGDGKKAIAIDGTVQIEQLFGRDNIADSWFFIGSSDDVCDGVGGLNDTVRVQIAAGCDATLYPAVDVTTTVTNAILTDPQPAKALSELIVDDLNNDANFSASWEAQIIGDNGIVHVSALPELFGEAGERSNINDFLVTATGTTTVSVAFSSLVRRGKSTELARNPDDPRVGILGVSGSIRVRADEVEQIFQDRTPNMAVNPGGTPDVFTISAQPAGGLNRFIEALKFYGSDGNIKVGESNFLGLNAALTNGILIDLYKDGLLVYSQNLKTTNDLLARWSTTASDNKIIGQSGGDYYESTLNLVQRNIVFELEAGTTDRIEVTIQDNISQVSEIYLLVDGFQEI